MGHFNKSMLKEGGKQPSSTEKIYLNNFFNPKVVYRKGLCIVNECK